MKSSYMINGLIFRRRNQVVQYLAGASTPNTPMRVVQNHGPIGAMESGWELGYESDIGVWDGVPVKYEEQGRMNGMGERALYRLMADVKRERGDS